MEGDRKQPSAPLQNEEYVDRQCESCGRLYSSQGDLSHLQVRRKDADRDASPASDPQDDNEQSGALSHLNATEGEVKLSESFDLGEEYAEMIPMGHSIFTFLECGSDLETHTVHRPFACPVCDKTFVHKRSVSKHLAIHTGEKPFACPDCGKGFRRKGELKVHLMIHTGEKPFACPECGKSFRRHGYLKEHLRIHTGERPYVCHLCGKTFTRSSDMRRHQRRMFFKCGLNVKPLLQRNIL